MEPDEPPEEGEDPIVIGENPEEKTLTKLERARASLLEKSMKLVQQESTPEKELSHLKRAKVIRFQYRIPMPLSQKTMKIRKILKILTQLKQETRDKTVMGMRNLSSLERKRLRTEMEM